MAESLASRVETLSAQPLTGGDWLARVRLAAQALVGGGAVAMLVRSGRDAYALAGFVDTDGVTRVRAPDRLEDAAATRADVRAPGVEGPAFVPFTADGPLAGGGEGLLLPWPLGAPRQHALLVLPGDAARLAAAPPAECWALVAVAGNLLRRREKLALIDAGAWIEDQISRIAMLQQLLQPGDLGEATGARFAVYSRPHAFAGGDYYDVSALGRPGGRDAFGIALADVSGHGPAAVVETAMIDSILRTYADYASQDREPGPASVLGYLNRHMFSRRPRPSFATMFAADWVHERRVLRYALAGHPPPLMRSGATGEVAPIDAGDGIPLQVLRDFRWRDIERPIAQGDLLVAYTDGVSEALAPDGTQFGVSRLGEVVAAAPPEPDAVVAAITEALAAHAAGRPFHDDQTLLVARFD